MSHPLDRPVWHALTGRQRDLATGSDRALRFLPGVNSFVAAADASSESTDALAALVLQGDPLSTVEADPMPVPAGLSVILHKPCHQMVAEALAPRALPADVRTLTDADGPAMLALATLTKPGPFYAGTHRLGGFIGVKRDGRLIAMAGERMKVGPFTEISGVCTHPDFQGRGLAGGLLREVAARILARGEQPFLHSYSSNEGAIALYESLGFVLRRTVMHSVLSRD